MKRVFLLIVVPALLVALGFAQTPAASVNTDQTIKGCLGGADGNYTVVEDGTGQIFKVTTSSIDFKQHLGHDVTLIGHKASGASSAAVDNSFAATELNMISEHCATAAAAPTAAVSTPSETGSTPPAPATAPAATTSTLAENAVTPAAVAAPAATVTTPAETVVTPAADAAAPVATVSTSSETARTPAAGPRRQSETPAVATPAPDVTANSSSETASTPIAAATPPTAAASTPSETASTPAAAATPPTATSKGWSVVFLIAFAVLVIVIGTMVPVFGKWRKRKLLERTGAQNLSFTREESSDKNKIDKPGPRKAA